jgi:hypothetical protein
MPQADPPAELERDGYEAVATEDHHPRAMKPDPLFVLYIAASVSGTGLGTGCIGEEASSPANEARSWAPAQIVGNSSSGGFLAASQLATGGRLVLLGDSSPPDDGQCASCSATLHDGWDEASARAILLNATAWLAHDGS